MYHIFIILVLIENSLFFHYPHLLFSIPLFLRYSLHDPNTPLIYEVDVSHCMADCLLFDSYLFKSICLFMNDLVCSFCIHFLQSLNSKLNQSVSKKQVQISKWVNAMDEELMTLNKNRIRDIVQLPGNMQ
jgi:hypothetical protein